MQRLNAPLTYDELLIPAEAARILGTSPKLVSDWARRGLITSKKTIGGHRRLVRAEIEQLRKDIRGAVTGRSVAALRKTQAAEKKLAEQNGDIAA